MSANRKKYFGIASSAMIFVAAAGLVQPANARVRAFFTSRSDDLPGAVNSTFQKAEQRAKAGRPASIDVAVFSFTHTAIVDELLRIAVAQPSVKIRIILDLGQISHSESHMGPFIEDIKEKKWSDACSLRLASKATAAQKSACRSDLVSKYGSANLSNVELKYKWYDGYTWSAELKRPLLNHSKSLLMHRKLAIVNRDTIVTGSFNWSPQAANDNYENVTIVSGSSERSVTQLYSAEFDGMWTNTENFKSGAECRALRQVIWDRLKAENP